MPEAALATEEPRATPAAGEPSETLESEMPTGGAPRHP